MNVSGVVAYGVDVGIHHVAQGGRGFRFRKHTDRHKRSEQRKAQHYGEVGAERNSITLRRP